jgi:flavin-dependent dehydrogenase
VLDVAIAGAGPAGISCAVALVRRDPSLAGRIAVFDRAHFPRAKPCGGGLTGHADEAMRALGLELTVPFVAAPRARVTFGAIERDVHLQRPVRIVRREEFDASLVAQARALGITVHERAAIDRFTVGRDSVELAAGGRTLEARILVGADGVGSAVRKHLHGERTVDAPDAPRHTPIRLFRAELRAESDWPNDLMLYDFSAMAEGLRGYVWIFPVPGGRLNVGLMHSPEVARTGAELTAMLERHLLRLGVRLSAPVRGWPAWGYAPSAPVAGPRLVVCGDAAGIDALTGEGIAVGMEQGLVCADAILAALDGGDFAFGSYRARLRRATVGRELSMDRWLARLLYGQLGGPDAWKRWLSLVLFDERMLDLYAARVCGSLVLSDHKRSLVAALARHLFQSGSRLKQLEAAVEEPPRLAA